MENLQTTKRIISKDLEDVLSFLSQDFFEITDDNRFGMNDIITIMLFGQKKFMQGDTAGMATANKDKEHIILELRKQIKFLKQENQELMLKLSESSISDTQT